MAKKISLKKRKLGWHSVTEIHFFQPKIKPCVIVVAEDRGKDSGAISDLKEGCVLGYVVLADNASEDGPEGTQ